MFPLHFSTDFEYNLDLCFLVLFWMKISKSKNIFYLSTDEKHLSLSYLFISRAITNATFVINYWETL